MSRTADLKWFESHRKDLTGRYPEQWIVVARESVWKTFHSEEEAVVASVEQFGINEASVFQAVLEDPIHFVGLKR